MSEEFLTTREDGTQYVSKPDIDGSCSFCGSRNIHGGSWSVDSCRDCGAVYFWKEWHKEVIK